jgi:serine/threonine-protein kinase RsbW
MSRQFERLSLPAKIESLTALREFARGGADQAGLSLAERDKLDLVLEELIVNIARYAYQPDQGDVELAYAVEAPGSLTIEITDNGRIFNPLAGQEPDLSAELEDRKIGGLGVFLAQRLASSMRYRRDRGRNTLSFRLP